MKDKNLFWIKTKYIIAVLVVTAGLFAILGTYFVQLYLEGRELTLLQIRHDILSASTNFNNTILKSMSVIDATSKSVEYMQSQKATIKEIENFLEKQTPIYRKYFNVNFTSLYGLIQGHYVDGNRWIPPKDYIPQQRPWYIEAMKSTTRTTLVPPYFDVETGKMVISMVVKLSDGKSLIVVDSYLGDVVKYVDQLMLGIGSWYIIDNQANVVFSSEQKLVGKNLFKNLDKQNQDLKNYLINFKNSENFQRQIYVNGKKSIVHHLNLSGNWTCLHVTDYKKLRDSTLQSLETKFSITISFVLVLWLIFLLCLYHIYRSYIQAVKADHSKSLFFAMVSHELRTPLNSIVGLSRLLLNFKHNEDETKKYLTHINDGGETLIRIVNDILDLSKLDADKLPLIKEYCQIPKLVSMVRGNFIFKAAQLNDQIVCQVDEDFPLLEVDKARVKQILFNIIGNAVKFTENGVITVKCSFKKESEKSGKLTISVSDTGCGISPEELNHILEPFVSAINSMRHGGAGLGLAICSRLIKKMHGKLSISSELGKGSCFVITLKHVNYKTDNTVETVDNELSIPEAMPNLKFLLCDDIDLNLKVLSLTINKHFNVQCECVNSAEKVLQILENEKFDALLTDMWMPEMNGDELLAKIRNNPKTASLPVYVVTADVSLLKSWKKMKFNGAIAKPINIIDLNSIISEISAQKV